MILTATGDTTARAQVVAKLLTDVGRTDIPIGVGVPTTLPVGPLFAWAADFPLASYAGTVRRRCDSHTVTIQVYLDGVGGAIEVIQGLAAAGETLDIIAIAPCNNFPSLLDRFPEVTQFASIKVRLCC